MPALATFAAVTGSLKTAADTVKSMISLRDAAVFQAKANELQGQISAALADAIAAYEAQTTQLQRIGELEKEIARFETWEREKQRYELKDLKWGAFAYMLKPSERGAEPPHWVCTNCYEHQHKATMQNVMLKGTGQVWTCPACKSTIKPGIHLPEWAD